VISLLKIFPTNRVLERYLDLRMKECEENYVMRRFMLCVPCQILRIIRAIKINCDNSGGHVARREKCLGDFGEANSRTETCWKT
jgi:hypothetical protein